MAEPATNVNRAVIPANLFTTTVLLKSGAFAGTGFFFAHPPTADSVYIITNKHVLQMDSTGAVPQTSVSAWIERRGVANRVAQQFETTSATLKWHPQAQCDLAAIKVPPAFVLDDLNEFAIFHAGHIPPPSDLKPIENIIMLGYPAFLQIHDQVERRPMARAGITAVPPGRAFAGDDLVGLADVGNFPGSSGSPILVHEGIRVTPVGAVVTGQFTYLIGVSFSLHVSEIQPVNKVPFLQTSHNSGYVRAKAIVEMLAGS